MLNVEHVRARREKDRLVLVRLTEPKRRRAVEIATELLAAATRAFGAPRAELTRAFESIEVAPVERRLADGLAKLIEDAAEFEQVSSLDPVAVRSDLFLRAAEARKNATLEDPFLRERVLAESAQALGVSEDALEAGLYADLRSAQRMTVAPTLDPVTLVSRYEQAQVQAVLLRAVEVVARVHCRAPESYRQLFQKLKFRKLLYRLERHENGDYSITIDGPFSMFEAVTKYGLELALTLPALEACDRLELTARVLWGSARTTLLFDHRHSAPVPDSEASVPVRDEVASLLEDLRALESAWEVSISDAILDLAGVGLCVPDLVFRPRGGGRPVYLELLGYWSREAVFRRLDLAEKGLGEAIIFAASSRLRVSEALLEENDSAALYVYKGKPNARAILRKLDVLASRERAG